MANVPINNITDTWNSSGTIFTGIKFNVTDTASAAGSLLMDLKVGGASKFSVDKSGNITADVSSASISAAKNGVSSISLYYEGVAGSHRSYAVFSNAGLTIYGSSNIGFGSLAGAYYTSLVSTGANIIEQRNGVNAQTSRLYGTYTDASNYRRLTKTMSAAGVAEIKPEGAGTGATGNVLYISGLPISNPGPGILWNNGGVVNVGT